MRMPDPAEGGRRVVQTLRANLGDFLERILPANLGLMVSVGESLDAHLGFGRLLGMIFPHRQLNHSQPKMA